MRADHEERPQAEPAYGTELHPRRESWARISTTGTLIGFLVFLVLAVLFILFINWRS